MSRRAPVADDHDIIGSRRPVSRVEDLRQLPLFAESRPSEAEAAREASIQQAHDHADAVWKSAAYAAIVEVARKFPEFTADHVWRHLGGTSTCTHNPSALGPLFRIAARNGVCRKSGRVEYSKLEQRHREVTVWESLILDQVRVTRAPAEEL